MVFPKNMEGLQRGFCKIILLLKPINSLNFQSLLHPHWCPQVQSLHSHRPVGSWSETALQVRASSPAQKTASQHHFQCFPAVTWRTEPQKYTCSQIKVQTFPWREIHEKKQRKCQHHNLWSSSQVWLILYPRAHLAMYADTFDCHNWEERMLPKVTPWHLMGRTQGCC